jgi:hypothetical protein
VEIVQQRLWHPAHPRRVNTERRGKKPNSYQFDRFPLIQWKLSSSASGTPLTRAASIPSGAAKNQIPISLTLNA